MNPVPTNLIQRFAEAFAHGRTGLSAEEMPRFFSTYQGDVPTATNFGMQVTKVVLFTDCVRALTPENQRLALYDLCDQPPGSRHPMPEESVRRDLLAALVQADGRSPLALELSAISVHGLRLLWFSAASRLPHAPASAITAARTLLESTCRSILVERQQEPDRSGDLGRLYKQTRSALGIDPSQGASQNAHQIAGGTTQIVDGLAGLSNKAGDRHGLEAASKIDDVSYAGLAVHSAGAVALFLARLHKLLLRSSQA